MMGLVQWTLVFVAFGLGSISCDRDDLRIESEQFNKIYTINRYDRMNFNDSIKYCQDNGGSLIMIRSQEESDFLMREIRMMYTYWLGAIPVLSRYNEDFPTQFLDNSNIGWYNWEHGRPEGRMQCATLAFSVRSRMSWVKMRCEDQVSTICEQPLRASPLPSTPTTESQPINNLLKSELNYNLNDLLNMTHLLQMASALMNDSQLEHQITRLQMRLQKIADEKLLKNRDERAMGSANELDGTTSSGDSTAFGENGDDYEAEDESTTGRPYARAPYEEPAQPPPVLVQLDRKERMPNGECPMGYQTDRSNATVCEDIDECSKPNECVVPLEVCLNLPGAYTCQVPTDVATTLPPISTTTRRPLRVRKPRPPTGPEACASGLRPGANNQCLDINECNIGSHNCELNLERCINTVGSYRCIPRISRDIPAEEDQKCPSGFIKPNPGAVCVDMNECLGQPCPVGYRCDNTIGSYFCVRERDCGTGYTFNVDLNQCEDDNECSSGLHNCEPGYSCRNLPGSFRCELPTCPFGHRRLRNNTCVPDCAHGYQWNNWLEQCDDFDECQNLPLACGADGWECLNTIGSFLCRSKIVSCNPGYFLSEGRCHDVDECERPQIACSDPDAICLNMLGSHRCLTIQCPEGYFRDTTRKNRCVRPRDIRACPPESTDEECARRLRAPLSYSYNFLSFPSNLPIPESSHLDLFTMRGPQRGRARVEFRLALKNKPFSAKLPPHEWATIDHFHLRTTNFNEAMISATRPLKGPQDIELELMVLIYAGEVFGGTSIANIKIFVSENES